MHILVCETRSTGPGDPARVPSRSLAQLGGRGESQNCSYTAGCCKFVAPSKVIMGIGDPLPYRPLAKISGGTLGNSGAEISFPPLIFPPLIFPPLIFLGCRPLFGTHVHFVRCPYFPPLIFIVADPRFFWRPPELGFRHLFFPPLIFRHLFSRAACR